MEYKIISGNVIEIRRCRMTVGSQPGRKRAPRKAGATSLKKINQNEKTAERQLARSINCNFGTGALFLTLKYSDIRLPQSVQDAKKEAAIREAEGQAQAIIKVQEAIAEGIRKINEAAPTDGYVKIKALEAFEKAADGKATKIIIPSEIQGLAGLAEGIVSAVKEEK